MFVTFAANQYRWTAGAAPAGPEIQGLALLQYFYSGIATDRVASWVSPMRHIRSQDGK
jgi:hypothetical protein